ncbi:hypothetical protein JOC95_001591 [Bacillus tianshenii]|uniref:Adenylyltransferase AadA C-terminal domain-containing protein n=1 Tax=Sutcliffiella tianshenii TaxID=1463404 RepID=A0ABS2NYI5_9BACI|nr:aminoglycoside adenylyltransferase domain-containing protein [Bacillus tianshenii]MBM7619739.1 hypothetical protein [Bacillus tianshenii]
MRSMPSGITVIVEEFIEKIETAFPGFLQGFYLYGSISLGAFQKGMSDIDFIAVIKQHPTVDEMDKLKNIHKQMHKKFSGYSLDGYYLVKDELEAEDQRIISSHYFSEGKFKGKKSFHKDSIDAFQIKKYGIIIKGQQVDYSVDFDIVVKNQKDNINTYWQNWLDSCKRFPSINYVGFYMSTGSIEWGVLGVTRLYYTIREKDMTSKVGAGEYALDSVPERWHKILEEAIRWRKGIKKSKYRSIWKRRADALAYMEYVIGECNAMAEKRGSR